MSAVFGCILLALGAANAWLGRSVLYPPALFALTWAAYLASAWASEGTYPPVSDDALLLFLGGAVAVSLGGLVVQLLDAGRGVTAGGRDQSTMRAPRVVRRLIDWGSAIVLLALPIRFARLRQLGGGSLDVLSSDFWVKVRRAAILESDSGASSLLALTDNLVLLSLFVALAAVADDVGTRRLRARTIIVVPLALFYQLSTASRSSGMALVCGLIGIAWMTSGRWSLRSIALGGLGALVVFSCAAVFMNKGGRLDAGLVENLVGVGRVLVLYAVGPIVSFDQAFADPASVPPVWSITYSLVQVANKLGASIALPSIHAVYVRVAPGLWMNVYTMYFAYVPDFGVAGALVLLCLLGILLTWLFRRAEGGDPRARLVYATTLSAIAMSGFNEQFFMNLSFYVKAVAFAFAIYGLPPLAWIRRRSPVVSTRRLGASSS